MNVVLHCAPVSYTHLDVYKRQAFKYFRALHVGVQIFNDQTHDDERELALRRGDGTPDVYKRQTEIQGNSHSVRIAWSCEFQFLFPVYYVDI